MMTLPAMPQMNWSGIQVGDCYNNPVSRCWMPRLGGMAAELESLTELGDVRSGPRARVGACKLEAGEGGGIIKGDTRFLFR